MASVSRKLDWWKRLTTSPSPNATIVLVQTRVHESDLTTWYLRHRRDKRGNVIAPELEVW